MAEIKPFRAWRYNNVLSKNIEELTSPLFDVVSEKQRQVLYKNPYNSIHLSVPSGENPSDQAAKLLSEWKNKGILKQDPLPGIYAYHQRFRLHGSTTEYCRKGFIVNIKTYDWEEKVILRHENTIPASVNDRIDLLAKTQFHVSPTHGLYSDPDFLLEKYLDEAIKAPIYDTEDYQGVRDILGVIQDAKVIRTFLKVLESKQIILADGHHRYEASLKYKHRCLAENEDHTGKEGYNYHFMYLTNTEGQEYRILPTHRLIKHLDNFQSDDFLSSLEPFFTIKTVENVSDLQEIILGKKWAFGILLKDKAYKIRLKPERYSELIWKFPDVVKSMDLTVMHFFIFEKILGIKGKDQRNSKNISFTRDFMECLEDVNSGEANIAVITQEISMEDVKEICYSGFMMPQKSTYFYPKAICGFIFNSIKQDEFKPLPSSCF